MLRHEEAVAQAELATLLQKPREARLQELVAEVAQRSIPAEAKLREVHRIDAMAELEEQGETVAQPLTRPLAAIKAIIKVPHARMGYFEYVFRQHAKVRAFARKSHVLEAPSFPPRVRLDPGVQRGFREQLVPLANDLLSLCEAALASGWTVLSKGDYNLIVLLKRLCLEVTGTNFRVLNYRDRDLVDSLRSLETYFLILHYRREYPERVIEALQVALKAAGRGDRAERQRVALAVATLLGPDLALPSLHDFILGLNIVKLRRMLSLRDLLFTELGEILNTRDFACPPSVQAQIGERVQSLQRQIQALRKQKGEIEHLQRVLPLTASGDPDFGPLASLYEAAEVGRDFQVDGSNLMVLAPRLLGAFDATFAPLLTGPIRLSPGGPCQLFAARMFDLSVQRVRQCAADLGRLGFRLHVLTRSRLITLKNTGKGAVAAEADALQFMDEAVRVLMEIASGVEAVLASPLRRPEQPVEGPAEPLVQPDREFHLPSREQRIVSHDALRGKSVEEALNFLVSVCYAVAAFFLDRPILLTLGRSAKIDDKIREATVELERLVDPQTLAAVAAAS